MSKTYMMPCAPSPNNAVEFNPDICVGCNRCVNACRTDVMMPNPEKGKPPIVLYPEECWSCGCCVIECPNKGAIIMRHPLNQSVLTSWKRKETGLTSFLAIETDK